MSEIDFVKIAETVKTETALMYDAGMQATGIHGHPDTWLEIHRHLMHSDEFFSQPDPVEMSGNREIGTLIGIQCWQGSQWPRGLLYIMPDSYVRYNPFSSMPACVTIRVFK